MTNNMKLQLDAVVKTINAVTGADVTAKDRHRDNVDARLIFYKVARDIFNISYTKIGTYLGKHHATVLHGLKQFDNIYDQDKGLRNCYEAVINLLDQTDLDEYIVESKDLVVKYVQEKNAHLLLKQKHKVFNEKIEDKAYEYITNMISEFRSTTLERILLDRSVPHKLSNILVEALESRDKTVY
jgi:uncharacterized protein YozE (UPF0346 family)